MFPVVYVWCLLSAMIFPCFGWLLFESLPTVCSPAVSIQYKLIDQLMPHIGCKGLCINEWYEQFWLQNFVCINWLFQRVCLTMTVFLIVSECVCLTVTVFLYDNIKAKADGRILSSGCFLDPVTSILLPAFLWKELLSCNLGIHWRQEKCFVLHLIIFCFLSGIIFSFCVP